VTRRLPGTPLSAAEPVLARLGDRRRDNLAADLLDSMLDEAHRAVPDAAWPTPAGGPDR
jgi:hypothetical protein